MRAPGTESKVLRRDMPHLEDSRPVEICRSKGNFLGLPFLPASVTLARCLEQQSSGKGLSPCHGLLSHKVGISPVEG